MKIVGISGSLRKQSYNSKVLKTIAGLCHDQGDLLTIADIGDFPLYNADVQELGFPQAVIRVEQQIRQADAVVFSSPEYNYSISGVLKNALDWLSRIKDQPFNNKAAAIVGASPGRLGTARAQYHLRQVGVFLNVNFINKPEVMIGEVDKKFDADDRMTDQATVEILKKMLFSLKERC